jgi:hypothetical protein
MMNWAAKQNGITHTMSKAKLLGLNRGVTDADEGASQWQS